MIKKKLTPKQQAFADFYIEFGNGTEAYIKAGTIKRG
ncbi:terminase small subunit [Lysinibacillus xylanilyticus]